MKYEFSDNPKKAGYVLVKDPQGVLVAEFYHDHALVVCTMYHNMFKKSVIAANEFMYGHILGMTYAMLFADRYPRAEITRTDSGETRMRVTDPVLGEVFDDDIKSTPGADAHAHEMLVRAFSPAKGETH